MLPAVAEEIQRVAHKRERRRAGRAAESSWLLQAKELHDEVFDGVAEQRNLQHPQQ